MGRRFHLSSAGNVIIPSYLALLQKGFEVRRTTVKPVGTELWEAEKDSCSFIAEDPILLLGLVDLYETRGEEWRATDEETDVLIPFRF